MGARSLATLCLNLALAVCSYVRADQVQPAVWVECNASSDAVLIHYLEVSSNHVFAPKEGFFDPWALVTIKDDGDRTTIVRTMYAEYSCRLPSGVVRVRVEPYVFNSNVLGRCGAAISAAVTAFRGQRVLMPRYAFETDCLRPTQPVYEIRIEGKSGRVRKSKEAMPELLNSE
jgi:hypothetical protein